MSFIYEAGCSEIAKLLLVDLPVSIWNGTITKLKGEPITGVNNFAFDVAAKVDYST